MAGCEWSNQEADPDPESLAARLCWGLSCHEVGRYPWGPGIQDRAGSQSRQSQGAGRQRAAAKLSLAERNCHRAPIPLAVTKNCVDLTPSVPAARLGLRRIPR